MCTTTGDGIRPIGDLVTAGDGINPGDGIAGAMVGERLTGALAMVGERPTGVGAASTVDLGTDHITEGITLEAMHITTREGGTFREPRYAEDRTPP